MEKMSFLCTGHVTRSFHLSNLNMKDYIHLCSFLDSAFTMQSVSTAPFLVSSSSSSESTRIEVNVSEFSRGEIAVKLRRDNTILVHALHLDQYAADNFFRKELVKTFPLPAGADVEKIRSIIRNNGTLTIDIPMLRDDQAVQRTHEELLQTMPSSATHNEEKEIPAEINRSSSSTHRPPPLTVPKRTGSLGDLSLRPTTNSNTTTTSFNIAEFLQSQFHPQFTPNGKKLILKVDTRGYNPDELTVRLLDNNLLVQGKKRLYNSHNRHEQKQFSQSIRLPDGIDKFNVTSQVMEDGILVIDVPLLNSVLYR